MKRRDFLKTSSLAFLMANGLLRNASAFPTQDDKKCYVQLKLQINNILQ
jgi:hypothetical protein